MSITACSRPLSRTISCTLSLTSSHFGFRLTSENVLVRLTATNRSFGSVEGARVIGDGHLSWGRFWGHGGHGPIQQAEIEL